MSIPHPHTAFHTWEETWEEGEAPGIIVGETSTSHKEELPAGLLGEEGKLQFQRADAAKRLRVLSPAALAQARPPS